MRILLPPSEAKNVGGRGKALRDRASSDRLPQLHEARAAVQRELRELLRTEAPALAARRLLLPRAHAEQALSDNETVASAPTMPALLRYSGIVYEGLATRELSAAARTTADRSVLILSGLFGVLRGDEPIPTYRVPAKATLPNLGSLASFWRQPLANSMPALLGTGLVIDLRSSDYAAMWRPDLSTALNDRVIAVRILSPRPDGTLGVISYPSKHYKGRLAAVLLERAASGRPPADPSDVIDAWLSIGGRGGTVERGPRGGLITLRAATSTIVAAVGSGTSA